VLKLDHKDGLIKSVPGVPYSQIFRMAKDGKDLLIASEGLVAIRDEKVITIKESIGGNFQLLDILVSKYYPDLMFCSGSFGISILKRTIGSGEEEGWEYMGDIAGISKDIYSLVEDEDGVIWGGTQAEAVYKIKLGITASKEYNLKSTKVELIGPEQGLKNAPGSVSKIRDKVYFPTTEGFFTINKTTNQFERDSVFSFSDEKVELSVENSLLIEDNLGRVLVMFGNEKKLAVPQKDGSYILEDYPINLFTGEIITAFFSESDSTIWLGSDEGLIRIDGEKKSQENKNFSIYIKEVLAGKDTLSRRPQLDKNSTPERDFKNNSIRFGFASPFFEQEQRTVYQTFLEGFEEDWSLWGKNTFKEYTNLSPGNYTFHVRSKNIYNTVSGEVTYKFIILSPWYATWWAYLIYVLLLILIIIAIVKWRSSKLKAENRILEERVQERTSQLEKSLIELKSTQSQLIQSEKMASLGELTAGIAHEIQNPLNFVNNFSEVSAELVDEIQEERAKNQEARDETLVSEILGDIKQNLEKINHHGKRADAIVKGMLEHSKTGSGEKELTNLNTLAAEYLNLSFQSFKNKNKDFKGFIQTDFDSALPKIEIVRQDIGRVLLNLINNALYACSKFSKGSEPLENFIPLVTVSTKNLGDKIQISVQDNGPGIPTEIKDKIFQPFFTTKPTGQGTGLG
ncbi:ATP-binding protein, partial [Aquiflexum sp.]|uniref:ATP-binding protein n=1 Tax=Aquiflexum sp. TaxID=1872584 RepID=UPI003592F0BD